MAARVHTRLSGDPLSVDAAQHFCADPSAGAVVVFTGAVRDHSEGRRVGGLTYEAYAERAAEGLRDVAARAAAAHPAVAAVWVEHRVGALAVGEPAVVVGASAAHRDDAFAAARWTIDEVKSTVAIWKQEHWADGGAHWPGVPD